MTVKETIEEVTKLIPTNLFILEHRASVQAKISHIEGLTSKNIGNYKGWLFYTWEDGAGQSTTVIVSVTDPDKALILWFDHESSLNAYPDNVSLQKEIFAGLNQQYRELLEDIPIPLNVVSDGEEKMYAVSGILVWDGESFVPNDGFWKTATKYDDTASIKYALKPVTFKGNKENYMQSLLEKYGDDESAKNKQIRKLIESLL